MSKPQDIFDFGLAAYALRDDKLRRLNELRLENSSGAGARPYQKRRRPNVISIIIFRPWRCAVRIWFDSPERAKLFEAYLKTGSGREFAKRHLW